MVKGFATQAIHGPAIREDGHRALRPPVYENVSFDFETARDIQLAFEGKKHAHTYSRISNPTVEAFEQRIRLLADAQGVVALSSGMAAITNVLLSIAETGSNIVSTQYLFGNTHSLFEHTLKPWGLEVRYADMDDPREVEKKIDDRTRAVFLESISNPQLQVANLAALEKVASAHGVPVILDGTLTTPYLCRSKDYGVAVEILSSTKYISGGATSVGGLIIDNGVFDWARFPQTREWAGRTGPFALLAKLKREAFRNLGSCMSAHQAYLQTVGLETLALRIEQNCRVTQELAEFLDEQSVVTKVHYPGLVDSPYHAIAKRQFKDRYGGLLTFNLKDRDTCFAFMDRLELIRRSTNLNDNKTLILHPASTIFGEYDPKEREAMGVPDSMLRLAVGIEDEEDLMDDLRKGLEAIT